VETNAGRASSILLMRLASRHDAARPDRTSRPYTSSEEVVDALVSRGIIRLLNSCRTDLARDIAADKFTKTQP
jgi:hypothetical protein